MLKEYISHSFILNKIDPLDVNLGPVSSKHLGRIFVFKTSYDISRTDFLFHQTFKRWEVPTFCPKLRTKKSASYHGIFVLNVCN